MSLEIKKLKKKMNEQEIIKGINLTIPEGEIYGFLGANGAGKTTIFRHILGIYSPDEGEITWQGRKVDRFDAKEVGYLPEERGLYPKRTVRQQLTFFGKLRKMKKKEIEKSILFWLDFFKIQKNVDRKISELSKGNQQKIQLIITLMHEPDLIILDEPFSGLDPVNTELLKQVILKEKERGATIIFSDHVMTNVEELCDDILMIRDGRVVLHGPVQDVRNQYGKTRLFVASEKSQEDLEKLPHVIHASLTKQGIWKLILDDENAGQELFAILTQGHYIATFDQQAPTIDEIFKLESGVEV